jgi:hypothetical protein
MSDFWGYVSGLVIVGIIATIVVAGYKEEQAWEAFKATHNCTVIGRTAASTATGVSTKGDAVVVTTSPKATYICDDGVSYTRDEY